MSLFLCPNASRSLVSAVRGASVAAPRWASTTSTTPMRWLSCRTSRRVQGPESAATTTMTPKEPWNLSRARTAGHLHQQRRTFFGPKIIRRYEDLPKDYRDSTGLHFRSNDLSETEVAQIFGNGMSVKAANHLLRVLHGRRVAGTLHDPAFAIHTAQYTEDQKAKALEYLRRKTPVEEVMNAGLRAEDELAQMERDMELAEEKKNAPDSKSASEPDPAEYPVDPVFGRSKFDEIRTRNIARRKAEEKVKEEERRAREAAEGIVSGTLSKVGEAPQRQITNPRIAEYYNEAQSDLAEPPKLTPWQRILPSAVVVALVIGFMAAVSSVYQEPAARYRLMPEVTPAEATLGAIIALNAMVYLSWKVPPLWKFLNRAFIFIIATPKPVPLFASIFSHSRLGHLVTNMIPLWFVGTALHDELGRAQFLTLFLGCGAAGFLGSLTAYTLRGWLTVTSMGASGATLGLLSAYFWEHRGDGFRFAGLPENGVHGIIFLAMIVALQLAAFGKTIKLKVDIASHMSGIVAGVLGMELIQRSRAKGPGEGPDSGERPKTVYNVLGGPVVKPIAVRPQDGGRGLPT